MLTQPSLFPAGTPRLPPVVKPGWSHGYCSEYKVQEIRECALPHSTLDSPDKVYEFWMQHVPAASWFHFEQETFSVMFLNTRRRITGFSVISIGTLDTILVHPREVFRAAIITGAAAIVLTHNHPSGDPTPSEADIKVTRDLIRAGQMLKMDVVDHVIIGKPEVARPQPWASLREMGSFAI